MAVSIEISTLGSSTELQLTCEIPLPPITKPCGLCASNEGERKRDSGSLGDGDKAELAGWLGLAFEYSGPSVKRSAKLACYVDKNSSKMPCN